MKVIRRLKTTWYMRIKAIVDLRPIGIVGYIITIVLLTTPIP